MKMIRLILAILLCFPPLAAVGLAQQKKSEVKIPPLECRSIDPSRFTSPPVTLRWLESADSLKLSEAADVFIRCKLSAQGKAQVSELVWCSSDDSGIVGVALDITHATQFKTKSRDELVDGYWFYHRIRFLPARSDSSARALDYPDDSTYIQVDEQPTITSDQVPIYPRVARKAGQEGTVWVKVLVNREGGVDGVKLAKSSGYELLDNAAILAAYGNRYLPAMRDKRPIAAWVTYKVQFKEG